MHSGTPKPLPREHNANSYINSAFPRNCNAQPLSTLHHQHAFCHCSQRRCPRQSLRRSGHATEQLPLPNRPQQRLISGSMFVFAFPFHGHPLLTCHSCLVFRPARPMPAHLSATARCHQSYHSRQRMRCSPSDLQLCLREQCRSQHHPILPDSPLPHLPGMGHPMCFQL